MFGIGLPEMIVIMAVALIVVGPEKLPDMARTLAKWVFEMKRTVNQVKESLTEEDSLLGSVQSDLKKTAIDLKKNVVDSDDNFTWHEHEPGGPSRALGEPDSEVVDMNELIPVDKSIEKDAPEEGDAETTSLPEEEKAAQPEPDQEKDDQGPPEDSVK